MEVDTSISRIRRCFKLFKIVLLLALIIFLCCLYRNRFIYDSINVSIDGVAKVTYGANDFNIIEHISDFYGDDIKVISDIDTSKVGEQEMILEVTKDGISKKIPILVDIVDVVSPEISINEEKISKTEGEGFDINSNISDILDDVDGKLNYVSNEEITDDNRTYYTYYSDSDINAVGTHNITVRAVDGSGNVSEKTFVYEVKEKPKPVVVPNNTIQLNYNLPANGASGGIVGLAYSLVGAPYVVGGTGPYGFDCSGFVQYVYAQNGIHVSRSSYTQAYDGYAVPYSEAQPGDILSWGTSMGNITHSALYVGNGMMIHATNPSQGVLLSNVAEWTRGSGTNVITVRRII